AIWPSLDDLRAVIPALDGATTIPLVREMMADLETPVSAFLKLWRGGPAFLLESIEGGERLARYSFIGSDPLETLTLRPGLATTTADGGVRTEPCPDPLAAIAALIAPFTAAELPGLALPRFTGGAVGYLSYEAVRTFEPRVGEAAGEGLGLSLGTFMLVDGLLVFDHLARTIKVVSHLRLDGPGDLDLRYAQAAAKIGTMIDRLREPMPELPRGGPPVLRPAMDRAHPNTTPERYRSMVERAKSYIGAGDIFQVVLSQRVDVETPAHPFTIYRALRTVNPSPYMFYLDFGDHQIVGASPEQLVRLEGRTVTNHPIAGTRPRGGTSEEDAANEADLLADEKERAEHIMLVDLGRNDVGRVAVPGSVRVPNLMTVERYSHVMHIVSNVEGELEPHLSGLDALRACFPAGTVSGAPKVRAMEIIAELETDKRGPYAGAVGYLDFAGGMDTAIALRTMVVKDGIASMQAGGGIVADSTPEGEYAESHHKMRGPLRAIELAEELEVTGA
ncbi:MAG TPA: anthranilate synthase component I, partial [Thermomicrobiales bacterium]|nr:anthranilate synthase component I [Thermomicrobiales bacterium]